MATATIARPAQALRKRDGPRPSITKRQITMDTTAAEPAAKKRKLAEPYVRDSQYILDKHKGKPASLIIHLHPTHFRFEGQDGSFAYDSPMKFLLSHLKNQTVPHEIIEELLPPSVPWYDGCLIVEVQNHRQKAGKEKGRRASSDAEEGNVKFSMHNYNAHVTPSPMVPFPAKAKLDETPEKAESSGSNAEMPAPERPKSKDKDQDGPNVTTLVLHPTALSQHHEMLVLAKTPAEQLKSKKRNSESNTPGAAQPPTPSVSVPPTPISQTSRGSLSQSQKMCLEDGDLYTFQSDLLVATEPPLYLEPCENPQEADKILDLLQHPLHQALPPSPKTRKRTTAEVAADDAQAAEAERRMLIMDERMKPAGTGAGANENQTAAASLGFSRFKTIEMVRQKHEEAERIKKEEEARAALEKKQAEEQNAVQQQKADVARRQREMQAQLALQQQQQQAQQQQAQQGQGQQNQSAAMQMRDNQLRAQQIRHHQAMLNAQAQAHGHPQQGNMMPNQQQAFHQNPQASMAQSSPIVRQQTPMMNSSPMMPQGGFAMAQTSSQGAGSPQRPTSGAVQNPMVRQVSQQQTQQQRNSQGNTPQMQQGTPGMNQAMPNRQMTQTPRMQPGSPATGMQQQATPSSASMTMQTPQLGGQTQFTPEQMTMLNQQRMMSQNQQNGGMQANAATQNMTPEQIQQIHRMQQQHNQMTLQLQQQIRQAQAQGNHQVAASLQMELQKRFQAMKARQFAFMQQQQQQQQQQHHNQMAGTPGGQAGSPNSMQQPTPQMNHAHPQHQQTPQTNNMPDPNANPMQQAQQLAQAQARAQHLGVLRQQAQQHQLQQAQQQLNAIIQQYNGMQNIPAQIIQTMPANVREVLKQQYAARQQQQQQQQNQARQAMVMRGAGQQQQQQQQQGQQGGTPGMLNRTASSGEQVPGSQPNPQYMQQLRDNQAMLAQAQQQMRDQQQQVGQQPQGGGAGGGGPNGGFNMNGVAFGAGQQGQGQQGGNGADLSREFTAMQNALARSSSSQGGGGGGNGGGGMQ